MLPEDDEPVVRVRVLVNVESLRKGWEGEVELSPRIQRFVDSGYLQIIGHVWEPLAEPVPHPHASRLETVTVANPARSRAPIREASDGAESADPA